MGGVKVKQMQNMKFFLHSSQVWRKIDSTVLTALPNECANWMYWLGANLSKKVGAPWEQDGSTTMGAGDLVAVRAGVRTGGVKPPPPSTHPPSVCARHSGCDQLLLLVWFKVHRRVVVCCSSTTL